MRQDPHTGMKTPWGKAQDCNQLGEGIWRVHTAGHGGVKLSAKRNREMPERFRNASGWYEEDCASALVVISIGHEWDRVRDRPIFRPEQVTDAHKIARDYFPDQYEAVFHVVVRPEDSSVRRAQIARAQFKDHWIGYSAVATDVGMVKVTCRQTPEGESRVYLVPVEEYRNRTVIGCICADPHGASVYERLE